MESSSINNSAANGPDDLFTKLTSPVNISKLVPKRNYQFKLSLTQDWVNELSSELNEEVEVEELKKYPPADLTVILSLEKKSKGDLQEYVIVKGEATAHLYRACVRCLCTMKEELKADFDACFIDSIHAERDEYRDQDRIFCDMEEHELYYYEKKLLDLKELVHEHLYLHLNQAPLHASDCKGLCQVCGSNLNIENCGH